MEVWRIAGLPDDPLAAAALFHTRDLPPLRGVRGDLLLIFPPADHRHRGWRLAAVQGLARQAVPARVNAVEADAAGDAVAAASAYLAAAPGLTGQLLRLDPAGAGAAAAPAP